MPHKRFQTCHAQGVIDAEIAGKGHLWTETNSVSTTRVYIISVPYHIIFSFLTKKGKINVNFFSFLCADSVTNEKNMA